MFRYLWLLTMVWMMARLPLYAQPPGFGSPEFGPPGFGPPGMRGGPGGGFGSGAEKKVLKRFDLNGDKVLDKAERAAAREFLTKGDVKPGPRLTPADVKTYGDEKLYDLTVLRTLFLEFENADWEKELEIFHHTDVEVPVTLRVDGKVYRNVGVHFRGNSSFMMVPAGRKRSLNLSLDLVNKNQNLGGYRTLNLLNSHSDPSFVRSVLFLQAARDYLPAPKANFVRVVINGESWGIYVNAQQFNTDFLAEWFPSSKGARWKTPGNPMARAGLKYLGDDPAPYKRPYEIKSKDDPAAWAALVRLCKVIDRTPPGELESALAPLLDVESTLKFLALDKVFQNADGYWTRASDYNIFLDEKGKFHLFPHDTNETWRPEERMMGFGRGPGGGGGFGGGMPFPPPGMPMPPGMSFPAGRPMAGTSEHNVKVDPFAGEKDPEKALLHKLLAVPTLRAKYVGYVHDIASKWLDWARVEPLARQYQALIAADVRADTRKNDSLEAFEKSLTEDVAVQGPMGGPGMSLKRFVEERRTYLLSHPEIRRKN